MNFIYNNQKEKKTLKLALNRIMNLDDKEPLERLDRTLVAQDFINNEVQDAWIYYQEHLERN